MNASQKRTVKAPKSQSEPSSSSDPYLDTPDKLRLNLSYGRAGMIRHLADFRPSLSVLSSKPVEIVIEPNHQSHYWEIVVGSCRTRTKFIDSANPLRVSNYLRAKAHGPINVIWNLM